MFDFAWSEIALIGVVALIAIGPKDLPVAIKAVSTAIKRARRMAGEFQTHVDDMLREANLDEVRGSINELRTFDIKGTIERAVDSDGSLRRTFADNPLAPSRSPLSGMAQSSTDVPTRAEPTILAPRPDAPAFIPPQAPPPAPPPPEPPAFIPPGMPRA